MRRVVLACALGLACGPHAGTPEVGSGFESDGGEETSSSGSLDATGPGSLDTSGGSPPMSCGDGILTGDEACDDGNVLDGDGCDAQCRVPGTQLWETFMPPLSYCPKLAALDDGGIAAVGNEDFEPPARIPHFVVIDGDGGVRWGSQGGHWALDGVADLVAEPGGFVVVGQGYGSPDGFIGWIQRWNADGSVAGENIFDADEPGDQISDIEHRDATSYWIVAGDGPRVQSGLYFRTFDEPPTSSTALDPAASDVSLARAPDEGAYVAINADVATLFHVDRDGAPIWTKEYDPESFSYALATTATGDAVVTGVDHGDEEMQWIRRFGPDGAELWRTTVEVSGVQGGDHPRYVVVDVAGEIVVAGESQVEGPNEGFLVKYDGDGVELWQQTWRPDDGLHAKVCDLVTTTDGTIVVAGTELAAGEQPDAYWLRAFTR